MGKKDPFWSSLRDRGPLDPLVGLSEAHLSLPQQGLRDVELGGGLVIFPRFP